MKRSRGNHLVGVCLAIAGTLEILACGSRTGLSISASAESVEPADASTPNTDGGTPCTHATTIDYVLDGDGILYTYNPKTHHYEKLGAPDCGNDNVPWTITASSDTVYILYTDWTLYTVDIATLDCSPTPFQNGQLGLDDEYGIAFAHSAGVDQLFVYGVPDGNTKPILATADLESFVLTKVADIHPTPPTDTFPLNLTADGTGNLVAFSPGGFLQRIDAASGLVTVSAQTGITTSSTWANIANGSQELLFVDTRIVTYDLDTQTEISEVETNVAPIGGAATFSCAP